MRERTIPFDIDGAKYGLRFNLAAQETIEREPHCMSFKEFTDTIDGRSARVLLAAFHGGLEGWRLETSARPEPFTVAEARKLFDALDMEASFALLVRMVTAGLFGAAVGPAASAATEAATSEEGKPTGT